MAIAKAGESHSPVFALGQSIKNATWSGVYTVISHSPDLTTGWKTLKRDKKTKKKKIDWLALGTSWSRTHLGRTHADTCVCIAKLFTDV